MKSGLSWSHVLVIRQKEGKKEKKRKKEHVSINLDSSQLYQHTGEKNENDNLELQADKLAGQKPCVQKPDEPRLDLFIVAACFTRPFRFTDQQRCEIDDILYLELTPGMRL